MLVVWDRIQQRLLAADGDEQGKEDSTNGLLVAVVASECALACDDSAWESRLDRTDQTET